MEGRNAPQGFDMSAVTAGLMNDPNLMAALAVRIPLGVKRGRG
jgi:hypothetical protein